MRRRVGNREAFIGMTFAGNVECRFQVLAARVPRAAT